MGTNSNTDSQELIRQIKEAFDLLGWSVREGA